MRATTALLLLPLQACIYYDGQGGDCDPDGDCWGWGDDDTGSWDDDDDTGDTQDTSDDDTAADTSDTCDTDEPPATIPLALSLDPAEGGPCTTLIASLTDDNGLFDLSTTADARFFGPVQILAFQARPDEVIFSLAVDAGAAPGTVDLLVEFTDGRAAFAEGAFKVTAATGSEECLCPTPTPL